MFMFDYVLEDNDKSVNIAQPEAKDENEYQSKSQKRILFINLADHNVSGKKSVRALMKKYHTDDIFLLDLLDVALNFKSDKSKLPELLDSFFNQADINIIKSEIRARGNFKIMIGVHGLRDDNEHCYAEYSWEQDEYVKLFEHAELAYFLHAVLEYLNLNLSSHLKISLVMCFGARSHDHTKPLLNYIENDFESSFAWKFFNIFTHDYRAGKETVMTARTGKTAINDSTGKSEVMTLTAEHMSDIELPIVSKKFNEVAEQYNLATLISDEDEQKYELALQKVTAIKKEIQHHTRPKYGRIFYSCDSNGEISCEFKNPSDSIEPERLYYSQLSFFADDSADKSQKKNKNFSTIKSACKCTIL